MLKHPVKFIILVCLFLGIFLLSPKFFSYNVFALVFDCASPDYYDIPPLVFRDPCTGVVEDAYDPSLVPPVAANCVNVGTGAECCRDLAAAYSSQLSKTITATCSSYCQRAPPGLFPVCPYYPPPDYGCRDPNYPNKCSDGTEIFSNTFCCNYSTPTPTPTPTSTPTPTPTITPTPTPVACTTKTQIYTISCPSSVTTGSQFTINFSYQDIDNVSIYDYEHLWLETSNSVVSGSCTTKTVNNKDNCGTKYRFRNVTAPANAGSYTYIVNAYAWNVEDASKCDINTTQDDAAGCTVSVVAPTPTPTPTPTPHS